MVDDVAAGRKIFRPDGKPLHLFEIETQAVRTLHDDRDGSGRFSSQDPPGNFAGGLSLGVAAGQHAADDAIAEVEIPQAVERHPASGRHLSRHFKEIDIAAGQVLLVNGEQDEAAGAE